MNHNPLNLQIGERCVLDKEFGNSSEVVIQKLTPKGMIATIYDANDINAKDAASVKMWDVMTYRLSKL